jgi:hypothetical protein
MARLVIAARRSLAYTFAIRYYLRGANKQVFFDFIQEDLESSLDLLCELSEQDILEEILKEINDDATYLLDKHFFEYKRDVESLK